MEAGVGMIIQDDVGEFLASRALCRPGLLRVVDGEAWRVTEPMIWYKYLGLSEILVETDTKRVAEALYAKGMNNNTFDDCIDLGRRFLLEMLSYQIFWICQNVNYLIHILIRVARDFEIPHCFVEPSSIMGTSCP